MNRVIIGTRRSRLAMVQAERVRDLLRAQHAHLDLSIKGFTTTGDQQLDRPIHEIGTKGLFTRELDHALQAGEIDLAVHSLKDLPAEIPEDIILAAVPERVSPLDCLIATDKVTLETLPAGARIGTSSLRRKIQLLERRSDLNPTDIRGNLDTRWRKLEEGEYDAILLALAGVKRLGWDDRVRDILDPDVCLPAPCQGALGITARRDDTRVQDMLNPICDSRATLETDCERAFLVALQGGCVVPAGGLAELQEDNTLRFRTFLSPPDGSTVLRREGTAPVDQGKDLGRRLARELLAAGGEAWVQAARDLS